MNCRWGITETLLVAALSSGCGGRASSERPGEEHPSTPNPASSVPPSSLPRPALPADLRFTQIAAGRGRYCGITTDQRLVCVAGTEIVEEHEGPYIDVSVHDYDASWQVRCAVLATGVVECSGNVYPPPPAAKYVRVGVGFFNACAMDVEGRLECWIPEEVGGTPDFTGPFEEFSVGALQACGVDRSKASCAGMLGVDPPPSFHYSKVASGGVNACGLVTAAHGTMFEGVWCWDQQGVAQSLAGSFETLSLNVNGQGCATTVGGGVRCFPEGDTPRFSAMDGTFTQVSVSATQACALAVEGTVLCQELP